MKQISWLSGLDATGNCRWCAYSRTAFLRSIPDGKDRPGELLLRECEEEVRLIFRRVDPAPQLVAAAHSSPFHARVVAGRDCFGA